MLRRRDCYVLLLHSLCFPSLSLPQITSKPSVLGISIKHVASHPIPHQFFEILYNFTAEERGWGSPHPFWLETEHNVSIVETF